MDKTRIFLIAFAIVIITAIVVIIGSIYLLIDFTSNTETFNENCLEEHNDYRSKHRDTEPLTLSQKLTESAKKKADEMSITGVLERTDPDNNEPGNKQIGENLWSDFTTDSEERYERLNCEAAVKSWYSEQKFYIYGIPWPTIPLTRHFTQVVWKSTKQLGCAKSYNKKYVYIVCHYGPKGNAFTQYKSNVMQRNGKFVDI